MMELTGWTYDELCDQPAELMDEFLIKIKARSKVDEQEQKKQERKGKH